MLSIIFFVIVYNIFSVYAKHVKFEFPHKIIPYYNEPHDPKALEFMMTRYYGGCYRDLNINQYNYSLVLPFISKFDIIVTGMNS